MTNPHEALGYEKARQPVKAGGLGVWHEQCASDRRILLVRFGLTQPQVLVGFVSRTRDIRQLVEEERVGRLPVERSGSIAT